MESAVGFVAAAGSTSFSYLPQVSVARFSSAERHMQGTRPMARVIAARNLIFMARETKRRTGRSRSMTVPLHGEFSWHGKFERAYDSREPGAILRAWRTQQR